VAKKPVLPKPQPSRLSQEARTQSRFARENKTSYFKARASGRKAP
jgi:hypothetical protein